MNKKELLTVMTDERRKWDIFLNKIIESNKADEIIEKNWILKDVILHMFRYDEEIKKAIKTRSLKDHRFWNISYPKRNAEIHLERDKYSLETVLQKDKENYESLLREIEKLNDEDIGSQHFFKDSRKKLLSLIKGNSYGHYYEHYPKLTKRFGIDIPQ